MAHICKLCGAKLIRALEGGREIYLDFVEPENPDPKILRNVGAGPDSITVERVSKNEFFIEHIATCSGRRI